MKIAMIPANYQPAPDLLADRVVLVTGAGDGLGRAASLAFARHGATVILLGRTLKKLEAVYDQIRSERLAEPLLMPVDLTRITLSNCEQIAHAIDEQFGRLDGLLHCAAILGTLTPLQHYSLDTWMQVMQVNFNAPYLLTRSLLNSLKKSESASVVFSSSDVARQSRAYWGAYAAAGAALENLAQTWADEMQSNTNIRINTFDPGPVRTSLRAQAYPGDATANLRAPDSLSTAYLFLMGKDSINLNGVRLSV